MDGQIEISDEDRLIVDALDPPTPLFSFLSTEEFARFHDQWIRARAAIRYHPFPSSPLAPLLSSFPAENSTPTSQRQ